MKGKCAVEDCNRVSEHRDLCPMHYQRWWRNGDPTVKKIANYRHGHALQVRHSPEYDCWSHIVQRCENPSDRSYANYGGRGITICERWRNSFKDFISDVGVRPAPGLQINRINNDGNYEPANVKWSTTKEQSRNKRTNRRLTVNGDSKSLCDWALISGISRQTIRNRKQLGWSDEKAIFQPIRGRIE